MFSLSPFRKVLSFCRDGEHLIHQSAWKVDSQKFAREEVVVDHPFGDADLPQRGLSCTSSTAPSNSPSTSCLARSPPSWSSPTLLARWGLCLPTCSPPSFLWDGCWPTCFFSAGASTSLPPFWASTPSFAACWPSGSWTGRSTPSRTPSAAS